MNVTVKFFAVARDIAGKEEMIMTLSNDATVSVVLGMLFNEYPRLAQLKDHLRVAVNWEYVSTDHLLTEHAEVAIIPPVSGG